MRVASLPVSYFLHRWQLKRVTGKLAIQFSLRQNAKWAYTYIGLVVNVRIFSLIEMPGSVCNVVLFGHFRRINLRASTPTETRWEKAKCTAVLTVAVHLLNQVENFRLTRFLT